MGNPVVHWELMSNDPEKVSQFYEKIFDWKIQHRPEMNYRIVETGGQGGINGGILKPERDGPWPGNMLFYIAVDDLAAYRTHRRRGRKNPCRGAGGARYGRILSLHGFRRTNDGSLEDCREDMMQHDH